VRRGIAIWVFGAAWLAAAPVRADSPPSLTAEEVLADSQGSAQLTVTLSQAGYPISAVQFDVQCPDTAHISAVAPGWAASVAGKSLVTLPISPQRWRVLVYGLNQLVLADGPVAVLTLQFQSGSPSGRHAVSLDGLNLSTPQGMAVLADAVAGAVIVGGGPEYAPAIASTVNAASNGSGPVAPGEIVVIRGKWLSAGEARNMELRPDGLVSTALASTRVLFDGLPAPMVYTTPTQVSAIVPYAVDGRSDTAVQVEYRSVRSAPQIVPVARSAPAIFTADSSGAGQASAVNSDGSVNASDRPAARGDAISIYGTGEGQTTPAGIDGLVVDSLLRRPILPVSATIDGKAAEVLYAGSAGGQVSGVLQVNLRIPPDASPGPAVPLLIQIGETSQTGVTIAIR
jgi:uncharacterized protein (TIGR03437 family)